MKLTRLEKKVLKEILSLLEWIKENDNDSSTAIIGFCIEWSNGNFYFNIVSRNSKVYPKNMIDHFTPKNKIKELIKKAL